MSSNDNANAKLCKTSSSVKNFWEYFVQDGDWFTWDRISFASAFTAFMLLIAFVYLFVLPNAFTSPNGTFLMDYLSFWLAGRQALIGTPEVAYQPDKFSELQHQISASETVFAFFYPPTFQLLQIPYAFLSAKIAHITFVATTSIFLWYVLRAILRNGLWAACLVLIPASLNNAFHGQNAALTAALYAIFLINIERNKPVLAGIALGILTIKPQLGLLTPFALIASYNWRCFASASLTSIFLAAASLLVLGSGVWISFAGQIPIASTVMQNGLVEWEKMISLYSSLRQLDINHIYSIALQVCLGLTCLACVSFTWHRTQDMTVRASVLIAGTLSATPFALSYDLTLLIIPCTFLIRDGFEQGFLPYEKFLLAAFIILSSSTSSIAVQSGIPVAPLLPFIILALGLRRYFYHPGFSTHMKATNTFEPYKFPRLSISARLCLS